jgi:hypothetical protein
MSAKYIDIIQADSKPVYGYFPFYYFTSNYWDQADWIQWHKKLVAMYDMQTANERFLIAWNDSPFLAANIDFRNAALSGNSEFIAYAKSSGYYDQLFSGILGTGENIISTGVGATGDVANAVGGVAESAKTISSYLLPAALMIAIVFAFYYFKQHKLIKGF